jgi:hypothetical protein
MVGGQFLSPLGTPFAQRALPPTNLNTPAGQPLANYHVYCVVKPFAVDTGPITQWFAEPSLGTQYKLEPAYLPECPTPVEASVSCLITNGYLVEERAPLD